MLLGSGLSVFAQPKASFDKTMHEFGTILWKNPVTATFKITNKGDKPVSDIQCHHFLRVHCYRLDQISYPAGENG